MTFKKRPFTLAWSTLETYETCPQKFLWSRGWEDIDLGQGPGRKKKPPVKSSRHHAVMGQAVGKAIEDFYNLALYKDPQGLRERLGDIAEKEFFELLDKEFIDWTKSPNKRELLETIRSSAENFLTTVKFDKLLGANAKAETEYNVLVDERTPINGRSDIEFDREDSGHVILDGKNSKTKGKYTDPDQLRWYALCYWLKYGKLPGKLGFVYFRYPANPEFGQSGVDWIPFTMQDLEGLAQRAVQAMESMRQRRFDPTPKASDCNLCDYESVCQARIEHKAKNARSRTGSSDLDRKLSTTDDNTLTFGFGDVDSTPKKHRKTRK